MSYPNISACYIEGSRPKERLASGQTVTQTKHKNPNETRGQANLGLTPQKTCLLWDSAYSSFEGPFCRECIFHVGIMMLS